MSQGYEEVKNAPVGQVVLSAEAINEAYGELHTALVFWRAAKTAWFHGDASDNELYYQAEVADIDVQIARAEVERLGKLMDLLELQVITSQMQQGE